MPTTGLPTGFKTFPSVSSQFGPRNNNFFYPTYFDHGPFYHHRRYNGVNSISLGTFLQVSSLAIVAYAAFKVFVDSSPNATEPRHYNIPLATPEGHRTAIGPNGPVNLKKVIIEEPVHESDDLISSDRSNAYYTCGLLPRALSNKLTNSINMPRGLALIGFVCSASSFVPQNNMLKAALSIAGLASVFAAYTSIPFNNYNMLSRDQYLEQSGLNR